MQTRKQMQMPNVNEPLGTSPYQDILLRNRHHSGIPLQRRAVTSVFIEAGQSSDLQSCENCTHSVY